MILIALVLAMIASAAVFAWAYHNSEKEREDLNVALDDFRAELGKTFAPMVLWLERKLPRR